MQIRRGNTAGSDAVAAALEDHIAETTVAHGGIVSAAANATALAAKADAAATTTALAGKAPAAATTTALAGKADANQTAVADLNLGSLTLLSDAITALASVQTKVNAILAGLRASKLLSP